MNNYVKIKAKQLLYQNTLKLFFISLLSFVFRLGAFALIILAPPVFTNTGLFKTLCNYAGMTAGITISVILYLFLTLMLLCFASGIGMGEKWIYLQRLYGVKPKFRFIFKYLSPRKSMRAFNLYAKTLSLKLGWLLYFMIPPALCFGCAVYLISRGADAITIFITALAGSILLSASIVLLGSAFSRYSQGAFYMCTHKNATARESLNFSITATDGHLNDRTLLHFSLIGWVLCSVLVLPVFYAVPYIKLCNVAFIEECRSIPLSKAEYAVNILEIHPNI